MDLSPSDLRVLAEARVAISDKKSALLLGAGFEKMLNSDALLWSDLACNIYNATKHSKCKTCQEALVRRWPTEFSLLAKYLLGDECYAKRIGGSISSSEATCETMKQLVKNSDLIISLNYSQTVINYVKSTGQEFRIFDRSDLASLDFQDSFNNAAKAVIFLHGRINNRSDVVFDAWDYNSLFDSDKAYSSFMEFVLSTRTLISLGCSWADAPLKNLAARVKRSKSYAAQTHLMFEVSEGLNDSQKAAPKHAVSQWKNAISMSYGVRPVVAPTCKLSHLVGKLLTDTNVPTVDDELANIADYLDNSGDFESGNQVSFLSQGSCNPIQNINSNLTSLSKRIAEPETDFAVAARLERHLRHHLFLYRPGNSSRERKCLWSKVNSKSSGDVVDCRLDFDHLVGGIELEIAGHNPKWSRSEGIFAKRLELAGRVWPAKAVDPRLPLELMDVGWEMVATKVWSDRLSCKAMSERDSGKNDSKSLVSEGRRIAGLSRMCGATRRQFKADIIGAVWNPDKREARHNLLTLFHSNGLDQRIEIGLHAGLLIGLLSLEISSDLDRNSAATFEKCWFEEQLQELGISTCKIEEFIPAKQVEYWSKFLPKRVSCGLRALPNG